MILAKNTQIIILISFIFVVVLGVVYQQNIDTLQPTIGSNNRPTVTNDNSFGNPTPTDHFKSYPTTDTVGLPFTFKYPASATLVEPGEGPVIINQNDTKLYFTYHFKANGIDNLMNNYQLIHTDKKISFIDLQTINSGGLSGTIANVLPADGLQNDTFVFLTHGNNNQQIYEFSYSSTDKNAYFLLIQILASFNFDNAQDLSEKVGKITGNLCYPSEGIPPGKIIAKNITTQKEFTQEFLGTEVTKSNMYSMTVPVGTYHLKFLHGYYTNCGKTMDQVCQEDNSHYNLDIVVQENQSVNSITPCDFYYNSESQKNIVESSY